MDSERLRNKIIKVSGTIEIYICILIVIAIAVFSINIIIDIVKIFPAFFTDDNSFFVEQFLGRSLELIIAIEFVKMIAHNTPSSAIELLIFTLARSIIMTHKATLFELLFGVLAIAILFGVRRYAHKYDRDTFNSSAGFHYDNVFGDIYDAQTLVSEINENLEKKIPARKSDTLQSLVTDYLISKKGSIHVGDALNLQEAVLKVNEMENGQIKQVELFIKK